MARPEFIILAGLPGTGKTTLARRLAQELALVYLRVDSIEAPFQPICPAMGGEGYQALLNLAKENLMLGQSVIADTVNPLHRTRAMFRSLAEETGAEAVQFELKLKDPVLHRKRVEERTPDIPSLRLPAWDDVVNRHYEPWDEALDGPAFTLWMDDGDSAFRQALSILHSRGSRHNPDA